MQQLLLQCLTFDLLDFLKHQLYNDEDDDDDFISITNMIYVVKKGVKNNAHDTKNDKSVR